MAGFDARSVLGKPRTPFLDVQLGRAPSNLGMRNDFVQDDPQRQGSSAQLGRIDPFYQTTGAVADRKGSETSSYAELLLDSLGPNAKPEEEAYIRDVIAAGGFESGEEGPGLMGKAFQGLVNVVDAPRRLVMAGVSDLLTSGEQEFSSAEAVKRILGFKPSADPDKAQGLDQFTDESGQLLFTGSQLLRAQGVGAQGDDDQVGLGFKTARGGAGFAIDMVLDPLNWITWGTLGLGKAAASAAARTAVATSVDDVAKAVARGNIEELSGFAEYMFRHMDTAGQASRDKIYKEAVERRAKELGKKRLSGELRDEIRNDVNQKWYRMQADAAQSRMTGHWDDYVPSNEIADEDWMLKRLTDSMDTSPVKEIYNDIDTLVTNKQFKTLEKQYSSFITDQSVPTIAKGGMSITTPFFRKQAGGINIGMFRGDRQLTAPAREVLGEMWQKMPYDGMRGTIEGVYKRWGTDVAERQARAAINAWDVDGAISLSTVIFRNMNVADAPQELSSQLRRIGLAAKEEGKDAAEAYTVLARMLDEGWDDGFAKQALFNNDRLYTVVKDAHTSTKATLQTMHTALKKIHPTMGEIEDYFPLLASNEFTRLLERMTENGLEERAAKVITQALEGAGASSLTSDQRVGLQILSQFLNDMGEDIVRAAKGGAGNAQNTAFQHARLPGKSLFSPLGGVDIALLNKEAAEQLLGEGVQAGWMSRVDLNRMINEAIAYVEKVGGFKGKVNKFDPFSMDLPDVLESYIQATSRVIHYNALIDEATRIGIVTHLDDALDMGRTIHEALNGPLSDAAIRLRRVTRAHLRGEVSTPSTTWVKVVDGWAVNLPEEIAGDPRVVKAFARLREQAGKATKQTAAHLQVLEDEVRVLVGEGIPEVFAREIAIVTSDKALRDAHTAVYAAMTDHMAVLKGSMEDMLAGVPPAKRADLMRVADGMMTEWMTNARSTIKEMNGQWRELFGFERLKADSVADMLKADPKTGAIPLAAFEQMMKDKVDALLGERAKKYLSSEAIEQIMRVTDPGDINLSLAKALDAEIGEKIWPAATEKAWRKVAAMTRSTNLTAAELVEELGAGRTMKLLRDMSGWTPPRQQVDDLVEVAEDFVGRRNTHYLPRVADRTGKASEIQKEYLSVPNVEIINDEVGDLTENGAVTVLKYLKYRTESIEQVQALQARGYKFIPFTGKGSPYKTFGAQVRDIVENKRVYVSTVVNEMDPAPMAELFEGMPQGNLFDALHIVMGHAMHKIEYSDPQAITTAWLNHGQMYSDDAREIFTTLTRGRRIATHHLGRNAPPNGLPRKIALMNPQITALNLDDWTSNSDFAVLAMRPRYRDLEKAADKVDALPGVLKEIEGEAATGWRLTERVEGTPASTMLHPETGKETPYHSITYRGEGREPVVHWTKRDYHKYVNQNKRKAARAHRQVREAEDTFAGKIRAAEPEPASEKGAFVQGIRVSPNDPAFDEAVAQDLLALDQYWTAVRSWQDRVLAHMGPNGRKNRRAYKEFRDAIKKISNVVNTTDADLVDPATAKRWGDVFPVTSDFDVKKGRAPFVSVDDWLGLQPPTPPKMQALRKADLESFPIDGDLGGYSWWAESFEDPDLYEAWKADYQSLPEGRDYSDTVDTLASREMGERAAEADLPRITSQMPKKGGGYYEVSRPLKTFQESKAKGFAVEEAVREMKSSAAARGIAERSAELGTVKGTKRVPTVFPQAELELASGGRKLVSGGIRGDVEQQGVTAAKKAAAYNAKLRARWAKVNSELQEAQRELAEGLKDFNVQSLFDEIPNDVLTSGFDHPIFTGGILEDLATAAEAKRRVLQKAVRAEPPKVKTPKGQKPGKTAAGKKRAKVGDADPAKSWDVRHEVALDDEWTPRHAARSHLDAIRAEADAQADAVGLGGLFSKSGNDAITPKHGKHTATVPGSTVVTAETQVFRALRQAVAGDTAMLARYEDDLRFLLEQIGLEGERLLVEPMSDGSFRFLYGSGDFEKTFHMVEPENLREVLEDWLPYPTAGLNTQQLASMVADLVEDGTFSLDVLPEAVRKFFQAVPDGVLPIDVDDYAYIRRLLAQVSLEVPDLRARIPKAARNQRMKAATAMEELLDLVEPFTRRRIGDVEELDRVWDKSKNVLEKYLSDEDFERMARLVEQAPAIRSATAYSRSLVGGNVTRRWRPVSEAMEAFDRTIREVIEEMFTSGADIAHAEDIAKAIDLFEARAMGMQGEYALKTKSAGGGLNELPEGYDQLTRNAELTNRFGAELELVDEAATDVGREIARLSSDKGYQNAVLRELKDLLPPGTNAANVQDWLRDRSKELLDPMRPKRTGVLGRANVVKATAGGVASTKLDDAWVDASFNLLLENMASHVQAAYTPLGMRLMSEQLRGFERYWKAAVTVARPTFVPRNVLGGVFNNGAIDVGAREYLWVSTKARQLRKQMKRGFTFDNALERLVADGKMSLDDAGVFQAARAQRIFDAEFTSDIADPLLGKANRSWNPAAGLAPGSDKTFAVFDIGGEFMQSSEDFLRMAAFHRWYDPNSPASAYFAQQLTFAVHFDYASLTALEKKIKKVVPFYVWTRRNIPLQAQLMMERPGMWNRYANIQRNASTSFEDREYTFTDRQPIPSWMGQQAADLDTVVDRGEGLWTRIFLDPDLPARDLEQLVERFSSGNPLRNLIGFLSDSLSPQITLPFETIGEDEPQYKDKVTAPTGLREVIKALNTVGLFQGDTKQGEPIVSSATRDVWETVFPYLREWTEIAGIAPADPMRAGDLGYRLDDGISMEERALGAFMGLGKAAGIRGSTPHDTLQPVLRAQRGLEDIENRARDQGRLPPGSLPGAPREPATQDPWSAAPLSYRTIGQQEQIAGRAASAANIVVDGDTLKLKQDDGTYDRVRLIGVNTPEAGELGATAASDFLQQVINTGGTVRLVTDIVEEDAYGRKLAYVWVGDRMLNLELVQRGLANPQPFYPNRAFERLLDG